MGKIVIGIDQSYQDTGISVGYNGKIKFTGDCYLKNLKSNTECREVLRKRLQKVFAKSLEYQCRYNAPVTVLIERIRLRSQGVLSIDYIKSIGALNALICDLAHGYNFPVYSVDTRAWKSAVIGTSKPQNNKYGFNPNKWPTIQWCVRNGYENRIISYEVSNRKKKAVVERGGKRFTYNDNTADSIGIMFYGFTENPKLQEEH